MSDEIKELEMKVKECSTALDLAKVQLHAARNAAAGINAGDIVKDENGVEYQVCKIVHWPTGKPWLDGYRKRADGTFGARRRVPGIWTKVSP